MGSDHIQSMVFDARSVLSIPALLSCNHSTHETALVLEHPKMARASEAYSVMICS